MILYDVKLDPYAEELLIRLSNETRRPPHELASVLLTLILNDMEGEGTLPPR